MRDPYAELAIVYDVMAGDPAIETFYGEWQRSLRAAFAEHRVRPRVLVDLACGTGNSTVPWARRRGLRVVGVDRSEAMLRVARKKSSAVRWYRQDLRRLRIPERADVVTCHFDALNHVLRDADLQRVFDNVARILREGGLFQFDLNTRHMLRWLGGRQKLLRAGPHWYMADNAFDPSTGVATFRQVWFVAHGRLYRKMEVVVRERAYDDRDVRRMLRRAGMDLVEGLGAARGRPADPGGRCTWPGPAGVRRRRSGKPPRARAGARPSARTPGRGSPCSRCRRSRGRSPGS